MSSSKLDIQTAKAFEPLLYPKRYKGAWGGRGSGKSHFFAGLKVERAFLQPGFRGVCIREVQKSLKESAKKLIEDKIQEYDLGAHFDCQQAQIITPGGGVILFQGMQDHTAESIKSLEGMDVAWIEEAQALSERSWKLLRPTIRKDGSEIWASWNPRRRVDPVDQFFRGKPDDAIACIKANWRDNPWFPNVLEGERIRDLTNDPDGYDHVWEGGYATVNKGAYYADALTQAKQDGRICRVAVEPMLPVHAFHDIGGAGAKADAYTIWIVQWVGKEIRVLDYYEARGQILAEHAHWMRSRGWSKATVHLPHDGVNTNNITGKRYVDHWRDAGFECAQPAANLGAGAASQRIEAGRRLFSRMWFDEEKTEAGCAALGWYHANFDDERGTDLGPEHDWSSHAADAFGEMCVGYQEPNQEWSKDLKYNSVWVT